MRDRGLVEGDAGIVAARPTSLDATGEVPPAPSGPEERLALWCECPPSPAPEMPRIPAAGGERYTEVAAIAAPPGKKPSGGHRNGGLALPRTNGPAEVNGKSLRAAESPR